MPLYRATSRPTAILMTALVATLSLTGTAAAAQPVAAPAVRVVSAAGGVPPTSKPTDKKVKYYVVQVSKDGTPEFLFELSERFLGDGNRFPEIWDLNKNTVQPGGGKFTDPAVLEPGWVLRLPDDAKGDGIKTGTLADLQAARRGKGGQAGQDEELAASEAPADTQKSAPAEAGDSPAQAAGDSPAEEADAGSPAWLQPVLLTVGAVLVLGAAGVGVVLLVRRRRSRTDRAQPFDDSLLRGDTSAAWTVDRALRVLLASCERDGLAVPSLTGAFIEGSALRLLLVDPASPAPAPWRVADEGLSWTAPLALLQSGDASSGSTDPFARLVNLGVSESGRVLVDFSAAGGLISLDGPTRARHEVLRHWLGELTQNPWSGDPRVVMVGNGLPQPEQAEYRAGLDQVVPELGSLQGGVLVLSQAPSASERDLLAARFADPHFRWIVIVLDTVVSSRWRFTATDDGWLHSGFLPDVRFDSQLAVRRGGE